MKKTDLEALSLALLAAACGQEQESQEPKGAPVPRASAPASMPGGARAAGVEPRLVAGADEQLARSGAGDAWITAG